MKKRIVAATPMICVIIYLCCGFIWNNWHPSWVVFFLIPIMSSLLGGIKGIKSMYPFLCVLIYLLIGFYYNWWHPGWIVFLTIPVFYTLCPDKKDVKRIE